MQSINLFLPEQFSGFFPHTEQPWNTTVTSKMNKISLNFGLWLLRNAIPY